MVDPRCGDSRTTMIEIWPGKWKPVEGPRQTFLIV
jgi:hypothetical protein